LQQYLQHLVFGTLIDVPSYKLKIMNLLTIIILLVVVGVVLYLINRFIPMDAKIKTILNWVVVIVLIVFLLKALGVWSYLSRVNI